MGRFSRGFLVGMGIGLLVAPMRGVDMRRLVSERYVELRNTLPDNEQLRQQFASGISQTTSQLRDYTHQAASKVKDTSSSLGDLAQQTTQKVKQTGQETIHSIR
jgi:gas vesicle protein